VSIPGDPRAFLEALLRAALAAADPMMRVPSALPAPSPGCTIVLGAGKAAARMAQAVEAHYAGDLRGLVVVPYGHALACRRIEVVEAAHPVPDRAGVRAAARALALAEEAGEEDLVLVLLSGGGSALWTLPPPGVRLRDLAALNAALLRSGATIGEMNCVRRHLCRIKGGRLARAAWPAATFTLAISDVPGDDPAVIASGPTVADPTSCADARAVLARYGITRPRRVLDYLEACPDETPKPGDPRLARSHYRLVARPIEALEAAAAHARRAGVPALILGDAIEGEAREVGRVLAAIARSCQRHGHPLTPPAVLLSGGETTVTVRGAGSGGRNVEFLLALALALEGAAEIWVLAADTDGIDGREPVAGAIVTPDTLARAAALGVDARAALAANDAHGFFRRLGDGIVTGPTCTNVNDFRAILVRAPEGGAASDQKR